MDCGPLASGFAFSGLDEKGNAKFEIARNLSFDGLFQPRIKYFSSAWNMSVADWLRNYVFMRSLPTSKNRSKGIARATLTTFIVSAIWHGFYPGFMMFFLGCFLLDLHQKLGWDLIGQYTKGLIPDII